MILILAGSGQVANFSFFFSETGIIYFAVGNDLRHLSTVRMFSIFYSFYFKFYILTVRFKALY